MRVANAVVSWNGGLYWRLGCATFLALSWKTWMRCGRVVVREEVWHSATLTTSACSGEALRNVNTCCVGSSLSGVYPLQRRSASSGVLAKRSSRRPSRLLLPPAFVHSSRHGEGAPPPPPPPFAPPSCHLLRPPPASMGVLAAPSPRTAVLTCGALTMAVFGTLFSNGYRFTGFHGDFGR